eukprot:CAMPEP_0178997902 /NCGR_PEP_ID=MMETSP0795-20121207/9213_1 /TAXON_ID=88552 /ORGANISM="Amoebophrya sp., Strain Ameob2" /LENGTH=1117 /DNA_ID=CAMNT_0020690517 /DNA_START=80 /DNA_END=3434 /DNA_ORIENTATION=-
MQHHPQLPGELLDSRIARRTPCGHSGVARCSSLLMRFWFCAIKVIHVFPCCVANSEPFSGGRGREPDRQHVHEELVSRRALGRPLQAVDVTSSGIFSTGSPGAEAASDTEQTRTLASTQQVKRHRKIRRAIDTTATTSTQLHLQKDPPVVDPPRAAKAREGVEGGHPDEGGAPIRSPASLQGARRPRTDPDGHRRGPTPVEVLSASASFLQDKDDDVPRQGQAQAPASATRNRMPAPPHTHTVLQVLPSWLLIDGPSQQTLTLSGRRVDPGPPPASARAGVSSAEVEKSHDETTPAKSYSGIRASSMAATGTAGWSWMDTFFASFLMVAIAFFAFQIYYTLRKPEGPGGATVDHISITSSAFMLGNCFGCVSLFTSCGTNLLYSMIAGANGNKMSFSTVGFSMELELLKFVFATCAVCGKAVAFHTFSGDEEWGGAGRRLGGDVVADHETESTTSAMWGREAHGRAAETPQRFILPSRPYSYNQTPMDDAFSVSSGEFPAEANKQQTTHASEYGVHLHHHTPRDLKTLVGGGRTPTSASASPEDLDRIPRGSRCGGPDKVALEEAAIMTGGGEHVTLHSLRLALFVSGGEAEAGSTKQDAQAEHVGVGRRGAHVDDAAAGVGDDDGPIKTRSAAASLSNSRADPGRDEQDEKDATTFSFAGSQAIARGRSYRQRLRHRRWITHTFVRFAVPAALFSFGNVACMMVLGTSRVGAFAILRECQLVGIVFLRAYVFGSERSLEDYASIALLFLLTFFCICQAVLEYGGVEEIAKLDPSDAGSQDDTAGGASVLFGAGASYWPGILAVSCILMSVGACVSAEYIMKVPVWTTDTAPQQEREAENEIEIEFDDEGDADVQNFLNDVDVQNAFLYIWGVLLLLVVYVLFSAGRTGSGTSSLAATFEDSYALTAFVLSAVHGLFVGRILKYAGSAIKAAWRVPVAPVLILIGVFLGDSLGLVAHERRYTLFDWLLTIVIMSLVSLFLCLQLLKEVQRREAELREQVGSLKSRLLEGEPGGSAKAADDGDVTDSVVSSDFLDGDDDERVQINRASAATAKKIAAPGGVNEYGHAVKKGSWTSQSHSDFAVPGRGGLLYPDVGRAVRINEVPDFENESTSASSGQG